MKNEYFTVHQVSASDEDAPPVAENDIIIVCDGLGSTGLSRHTIIENGVSVERKSAYLASRIVSTLAKEYLSQNIKSIWSDPKCFLEGFKSNISNMLERYIIDNNIVKGIRGRSIELLPTTLAAGIINNNPNKDIVEIAVIWSGDSRVYLLTKNKGMMQLTRDDVDGEFDAMITLGTSKMNNCITGEGSDTFHISCSIFKLSRDLIGENSVFFACSDGVFDYLPSPMALEQLILSAFFLSPDDTGLDAVEKLLTDYYQGPFLKDDVSIAGIIVDYSDLTGFKTTFQSRFDGISSKYQNVIRELLIEEDQVQTEFDREKPIIKKSLCTLKHECTPMLTDILSNPRNQAYDVVSKIPFLSDHYLYKQQISRELCAIDQQIARKESKIKVLLLELCNTFFSELKSDNSAIFEIATYCLQYTEDPIDATIVMKKTSEWEASCNRSFYHHLSSLPLNMNIEPNNCACVLTNAVIHSSSQFLAKIYSRIQSFLDTPKGKEKSMEIYTEAQKTDFSGYIGRKGFERTNVILSNLNSLYIEIYAAKADLKKIMMMHKTSELDQLIKTSGNEILLQFIAIPNICMYLDYGISVKIKDLINRLKLQEIRSKRITEIHESLLSLWHEYKDNYEMYDHSDLCIRV